jgi:hypothetical protein
MPQMVSHKVSVQVDKGPKIESEGKLEAASYSAWIEEEVCRCGDLFIDLGLAPNDKICLLAISADKYTNDKDICPANNSNGNGKGNRTCLQYRFTKADQVEILKKTPCTQLTNLSSPHVLTAPYISDAVKDADGVYVSNPLSINVKFSVLLTRQPKCACPAPASAQAGG